MTKPNRPKLQTLKPRVAMADLSIAKPLRRTQKDRGLHTNSAAWRRLRQQILTRDMYRCAFCGGSYPPADTVDHADGNSWNNDPANLRACHADCHSQHGKKGGDDPSAGSGGPTWSIA